VFTDLPLLSLLIWLPLIGGIAVIGVGDRSQQLARQLAFGVSLLTFLISLPLWGTFDTGTAAMQFVERVPWIPVLSSDYHLGVDGVSMPLIVLTTFITVLRLVSDSGRGDGRRVRRAGRDAVLRLLGSDADPDVPDHRRLGRAEPVYATIKFFLYTFLGSVFMLIALIYLYLQTGFIRPAGLLRHSTVAEHAQRLIFRLPAAFAVKVPMWPVHTWLPDAHVEAPTGGSVILAAIMLKIGGYGFLRFSLPITPDASSELDWLIIALSLIAVVYIGFVALVQQDMKKLIAYSSIAHMGFVTLGFFIPFGILRATGGLTGAALGIEGGMVQMMSHGFISGAMFLCVGVLYDRMHSREISAYGGVVNTMPWFAALMVLFAMANAGLPGTSGFVGEFMVILAQLPRQLLVCVAGGHDADPRRGLHAVDGQARRVRRQVEALADASSSIRDPTWSSGRWGRVSTGFYRCSACSACSSSRRPGVC
jgi:NADH-quinone oxidoreductase subunit M